MCIVKEKSQEAKAHASVLTTLMGEVETKAKREQKEITDEVILASIKASIKNINKTYEESADKGVLLSEEKDILND